MNKRYSTIIFEYEIFKAVSHNYKLEFKVLFFEFHRVQTSLHTLSKNIRVQKLLYLMLIALLIRVFLSISVKTWTMNGKNLQ